MNIMSLILPKQSGLILQDKFQAVWIKVWTNSALNEKWQLRTDLIATIWEWIIKLQNEFSKKCFIVLSWAVTMWSQNIKRPSEITDDNLWKSICASRWQPILFNQVRGIFNEIWLRTSQVLVDDSTSMKYVSWVIVWSMLAWVTPIINYNDSMNDKEIKTLSEWNVDLSDNDNLTRCIAKWINEIQNAIVTDVVLLTDVCWILDGDWNTIHVWWVKKYDLTLIEEQITYLESFIDPRRKKENSTWWASSKTKLMRELCPMWTSVHIAPYNEGVWILFWSWSRVTSLTISE